MCIYCDYMADIKFSRHARLRMVERGISANEVSNAINKGSKNRQNGKILAVHKHLEVVFKKQDDICYVITVMLRW